jgi:hypothetical protein
MGVRSITWQSAAAAVLFIGGASGISSRSFAWRTIRTNGALVAVIDGRALSVALRNPAAVVDLRQLEYCSPTCPVKLFRRRCARQL